MRDRLVDSALFLLSHFGCYASMFTTGKRSCQAKRNYCIVRCLTSTQRSKKDRISVVDLFCGTVRPASYPIP